MSSALHTPNGAPTNQSKDKTQTAHSTGVADKGRWSTQRIAIYALFVALAMVASFAEVSIIPGANDYKYDPSGIIDLVAGFAFGPTAALIVSVLGFIPHLYNPIGAIIAILSAIALSVPAALVYQRLHTRKGAVISLVVGGACALIAAIALNFIFSPIYFGVTIADVAKMIIPILLPFNLAKLVIHGVVTFLIYKPISNYLNR